jgi:MFS family permease
MVAKFARKWRQTLHDELYLPGMRTGPSAEAEEVARDRRTEKDELGDQTEVQQVVAGEELTARSGMNKYWTIIAAGAGLFSDGYVNNSVGTVNTILTQLYGDRYTGSPAASNIASIAFAGTVVGQLVFGYVADYHSRTIGMIISTVILIVFTILSAGAWGAGGSVEGMFAALTAYRMFLGIGIGGEYPAGSVACAEASNILGRGRRNRWFVLFTNFMIDTGFVVSAFVPMVMLWICSDEHLTPVWRVSLGLGAIPPCILFYLRLKFNENEQFKKYNMKNTRFPYWLILKYYAPRLLVVSAIWFIYDFSAYAFGIYSSAIINVVVPDGDLYKTFGWNVVLNLFYIPGSFAGAFAADYLGPRITLVLGVGLQGVIGFIMASQYEALTHHIGGFVVVYGIFMTLGEFGPGDQMGLIASKTSATPIRGQYYGIAAALGKVGAFVGTYVFPIIVSNAGGSETTAGNQAPFWVASSLCLFSAFLGLFFLPSLTQDAVNLEDIKFKRYLSDHGFDISQIGDADSDSENNPTTTTVETTTEHDKSASN